MRRIIAYVAVILVFVSIISPVFGATFSISSLQPIQWSTVGSAYIDAGNHRIILTPDKGMQAGAAWFVTPVSLLDPFSMDFKVYLGSRDDGADGIAFVLQYEGLNAIGEIGGSVGYVGIESPSLAVKIDTYGDSQDYIVLMINGTEVGEKEYIGNVEDGKEHNFSIQWLPSKSILRVVFDEKVINYHVDIIHSLRLGKAYFGFTGATGGYYNLQYFRIELISGTFEGTIPSGGMVYPSSDWISVGDASVTTDKLILTPNQNNKRGAVWLKHPVDLRSGFDLIFNVFSGASDGADGIAFVLQSQSLNALGVWGFGVGYIPIYPSVAVKIDTDQQLDPISSSDYIALFVNGREVTKPVPIEAEDNREHRFEVRWDPNTQIFSVYYDDTEVISTKLDLVKVLDSNSAYLGFTGATGGLSNFQYVRQVSLSFKEGGPVKTHQVINPNNWSYIGRAEYKPGMDAIKIGLYTSSDRGAVWYKTPIDFSKPVDIDVLMSVDIAANKRSNGAAVVFQTAGTLGIGNNDLADNIGNWLALEIRPGSSIGLAKMSLISNGVVLDTQPLRDFYSDELYRLHVSWNPTDRKFVVYVNGERVIDTQLPEETIVELLSRPVYLGFTKGGGTGATLIKPISIKFEKFGRGISEKWAAVGSASYDSTSGDFILTPDEGHQRGAFWLVTPVNVTKNFTAKFALYLGSHDNGADGLAIVLQSRGPNVLGLDGNSVGYIPIYPSVAVKIDTYGGTSDYVILMIDGHGIAGTKVNIENIEDGKEHIGTLRYQNGILSFTLDEKELITQRIDLSTVLGSEGAYLGVTAGTGDSHNLQYFRPLSIQYTPAKSVNRPKLEATHNWNYVGSASMDVSSGAIVFGEQAGAAWLGTPINFTKDFDLRFLVKPEKPGIALVFQKIGTEALGSGTFKDQGLSPSITLEITSKGDDSYGITLKQNDKKLKNALVSNVFIGDAFPIEVLWNATSSEMIVKVNGETLFSSKISMDTKDIGISPAFYVGFTSPGAHTKPAFVPIYLKFSKGTLVDLRDEWSVVGHASFISGEEISFYVPYEKVDAAWFKRPLDTSKPLYATLLVKLSDFKGQGGFAVVLQNSGLGVVGDNRGTGSESIKPSVAFRFNYQDYRLYFFNGSNTKEYGLPKITDGEYHNLTIVWNPDEKLLSLYVDGNKIASGKTDLEKVLGSKAYFGITFASYLYDLQDYVIPIIVTQDKNRIPSALLLTPSIKTNSPFKQFTNEKNSMETTLATSTKDSTYKKIFIGLLFFIGGTYLIVGRKKHKSKHSKITYHQSQSTVKSQHGQVKGTETVPPRPHSKREPYVEKSRINVPGFPRELLDHYVPLEFLGEGGFAKVFKVKRRSDGKIVALKIPKIDKETSSLFLKEVAAWYNLNHKNIVRLYKADILPVPYLEMEFVEGVKVGNKRIRNLGSYPKPVDERTALRIVKGIAKGLNYAHSKGIYHLDLKPLNILLKADLTPKIADWGLSKISVRSSLTQHHGYTPLYAAPEQLMPGRYGSTDHRTDIWQLGIIFYELLTGKLPFEGYTYEEVRGKITDESYHFVPPSKIDPRLAKYDRIIKKLLARRKKKRYGNIHEFLRDLETVENSKAQYTPSEREIEELKKRLQKSVEALKKSRSTEEEQKNRKLVVETLGKLALAYAEQNKKAELLNTLNDLKYYTMKNRKDITNAINTVEIMIKEGVNINEDFIERLKVLVHNINRENGV